MFMATSEEEDVFVREQAEEAIASGVLEDHDGYKHVWMSGFYMGMEAQSMGENVEYFEEDVREQIQLNFQGTEEFLQELYQVMVDGLYKGYGKVVH